MPKLFKRTLVYTVMVAAVIAVMTQSWITRNTHAARMLHVSVPSITTKQWLNSQPLSRESMLGKVYMVEFWTYGCYNCVNVEPYVKKWRKQYHQQGFEVVSVHSPEFAHERDISNVRKYVKKHGIEYPVAIDNDFAIWKRFNNRYWPAMYLVDKKGIIRYAHFGEGRYSETEAMIKALLKE